MCIRSRAFDASYQQIRRLVFRVVKHPEQIEHKGTVISVEGEVVRVAIEVSEACGGCSARKTCAMEQTAKREIEVRTDNASDYAVNELVKVGAKQSFGVVAVVLCYVVPLVVMVSALAIAIAAGIDEGVAAIISLGITALYYALLALLKDKISRKITFTINKL